MRLTILFTYFFSCMILCAQEETPSDQHFWYTLETAATPNKIWEIWIDVANWKRWDTGLKDASMEGSFEVNASGVIISLEGRKSKFKVVEFKEGISYTYKTRLPLGSLYVKRVLNIQGTKTTFTHEVWFSGFTKGIFAKAFGGKFREMLPEVMENVKKIAEE